METPVNKESKGLNETNEALVKNIDIKLLNHLTADQSDRVRAFRLSVSDMYGRVRTPPEEDRRSEKYCSDGDIKKWMLAFDGSDLIGMTVIFGRTIEYDGTKVSLGGIGRVRVREDRRKEGIASKMMREAMRQLSNMKYDVALLWINPDSFLVDFYNKYGFLTLNKPYTYRGRSGKIYTEHNGMIAPICSKEVFQKIVNNKKRPLDIGEGNW